MSEVATLDEHRAPATAEAAQGDLSMLARVIIENPDIDIEKVRMLREMMNEEKDREARLAFNRDFVALGEELGPIVRNKKNKQTDSQYADISAIADLVDPLMAKHGFKLSFDEEPSDRPGYYRVVGYLIHKHGHEKTYRSDVPIDMAGIQGKRNKTDTHAHGSTKTYGRRYLKIDIFDLATKDGDDDGQAAGTAQPVDPQVTPEQADALRELMLSRGKSEPDFLAFLALQKINAESLSDLTLSQAKTAKAILASHKKVEAEQ